MSITRALGSVICAPFLLMRGLSQAKWPAKCASVWWPHPTLPAQKLHVIHNLHQAFYLSPTWTHCIFLNVKGFIEGQSAKENVREQLTIITICKRAPGPGGASKPQIDGVDCAGVARHFLKRVNSSWVLVSARPGLLGSWEPKQNSCRR